VEPTKRSEEIQTILKLDEIGQTRSGLNTAQNRLQSEHRMATAQLQSARNTLLLHLQIESLRSEDLLESINARRKLLDLSMITELTAETKFDAGLSTPPRHRNSTGNLLSVISRHCPMRKRDSQP